MILFLIQFISKSDTITNQDIQLNSIVLYLINSNTLMSWTSYNNFLIIFLKKSITCVDHDLKFFYN